jgi:hypothetical protein
MIMISGHGFPLTPRSLLDPATTLLHAYGRAADDAPARRRPLAILLSVATASGRRLERQLRLPASQSSGTTRKEPGVRSTSAHRHHFMYRDV